MDESESEKHDGSESERGQPSQNYQNTMEDQLRKV